MIPRKPAGIEGVLFTLFSCQQLCKGEKNMGKTKTVKSYEELKFSDDFMFGKIMEDKELCREVLECLLQQPVGELTEVQTQREFRYTSDGEQGDFYLHI
jgi:hypothetical protein